MRADLEAHTPPRGRAMAVPTTLHIGRQCMQCTPRPRPRAGWGGLSPCLGLGEEGRGEGGARTRLGRKGGRVPLLDRDGWMDGYLELCGGLFLRTQARGSGCSTSQPAACADFLIGASDSHRAAPRWPLTRAKHGTGMGTNTGTGVAHSSYSFSTSESELQDRAANSSSMCAGSSASDASSVAYLGYQLSRVREKRESPRSGQNTGAG